MAPYQKQRLDEIINKIKPYKALKDLHRQHLQDARQQGKTDWQVEELEICLANERWQSSERKTFSELANKAANAASSRHDTFEKYFRAAHSIVFLGIQLDPTNL